MKDVRIDQDGELRCWNCGSKGFTEKRTFRAKALVGVGALLTKKKLKCQVCGEYNDTGNAKPYDGPASRKWRKAYEKELAARSQSQPESQVAPSPARGPTPASAPGPAPSSASVSLADELKKLAELRDNGVLTEDEFATQKARLLSTSEGDEIFVRMTSDLREWDVPDEGEEDIWWRGYDLHDQNNRGWKWDDPSLARAGIIITRVAGVQHYQGMSLEAVQPGRRLRLIAEPENPYDANAIAIWDADGQQQIGHLPKDVAASVSESFKAGRRLDAVCIAELIKRPGDARAGLRVVLAPPGLVRGWPSLP